MLTGPRDVTRREFFILLPFAILTILFGIWPGIILDTIKPSIIFILS
jgi:hypothetical protein